MEIFVVSTKEVEPMVGSICKKKCRIERASLPQWQENTKTDFFIAPPAYNVTNIRGIKSVISRIRQ
jgi:hypothetical protein